jgi:hypothetical protein
VRFDRSDRGVAEAAWRDVAAGGALAATGPVVRVGPYAAGTLAPGVERAVASAPLNDLAPLADDGVHTWLLVRRAHGVRRVVWAAFADRAGAEGARATLDRGVLPADALAASPAEGALWGVDTVAAAVWAALPEPGAPATMVETPQGWLALARRPAPPDPAPLLAGAQQDPAAAR